jgi:hypothetical protein
MGTAVGIIVGLGAIVFGLVKFNRWRLERGEPSSDMGSVSRVWIIENRVNQRDERS